MKKLELTEEEAGDISFALNYWANYIETGDLNLSAKDAQNMGKKFKALDISQMKKVIALRELGNKVLMGRLEDFGA